MTNEFDTNEDLMVNIEESTLLDDDAKRAEKLKSDKKADARRLRVDPYADKDLLEELY
jgi:hypothetical protein